MPARLAFVYFQLVVATSLWGATWISGRMLAQTMAPFNAALLRFVVATAFLFLVACRAQRRLPRLPRHQVLPVALLGLTGVFAYNALFFTGLQTVQAGRAALIVAGIPALVCLGSAAIFRERLTPMRWLGVFISLAGVFTVLSHGDPGELLRGGVSFGDACILGCVVCWSAYSLIGKKVMAELSPLVAVAWSCVFGVVFLLPFALGSGLVAQAASASLADWGHVLFLGILATGVSFTWYYAGIKALGPSRAGIFINLVPVVAIALGCVVLDEPVTMSLVAGGALVITGVWLTNRMPRPHA